MRDWLNTIVGQDGGRAAQMVLALVAVLLLLVFLAWLYGRIFGLKRNASATTSKSRNRLAVVDASDVDGRRRLVLIRRDDIEHLIMIGGPNDLLIESRIVKGAPVAQRPNIQQMPRPTAPSELPQPVSTPALAPAAAERIAAPSRPTKPSGPPPAALESMPPAPSRPVPPPQPQPAPEDHGQETPPPPRRPTLTDVLSAAATARREADEDYSALQTPEVPVAVDFPAHTRDEPTVMIKPAAPRPTMQPAAQEVMARELERALVDLDLSTPAPPPTRPAPSPQPQPVIATQQPVAPPVAVHQEPASAPAIPRTMPPVPPRPTPVSRPQVAAVPERQPEPVAAQQPTPATLPPLAQPAPRPPAPQVAQQPAQQPAMPLPQPVQIAQAKKAASDELEEKMAKLLSELGGPPTR